MRVPTDLIHEAKCSVCCAPSIMECVECIKEDAKCSEAPSFCSSKCYSKHFSAHRQRSFGSKRFSSSSGSSSVSSGSSSPSLGCSSEPSSPSSPLMGFQQLQQQHSPAQHHYVQQQYIHMQPPPPRGYHAPMMMHRHPIEVGVLHRTGSSITGGGEHLQAPGAARLPGKHAGVLQQQQCAQ